MISFGRSWLVSWNLLQTVPSIIDNVAFSRLFNRMIVVALYGLVAGARDWTPDSFDLEGTSRLP